MALDPPFIVCVENKPDSLGDTMNRIRGWLDHRKIEPASFRAATNDGGGFAITFASADEVCLFEREFADLILPVGLPA